MHPDPLGPQLPPFSPCPSPIHRLTGELLSTLEGHTYIISAVAISSDGGVVVSGSWDMSVRLWNRHTGV